MTREQALEEYARLSNKRAELDRQLKDLKAIVFGKELKAQALPAIRKSINTNEEATLRTLKEWNKPVTIHELVDLTNIKITTLYGVLDRLRKRGYVNSHQQQRTSMEPPKPALWSLAVHADNTNEVAR